MATWESIGVSSFGTSSAVVTKPTGLAVGDLMIAHLASREGGGIEILSGWSDVGDGQIDTSSNGVNLHQRILYKIADSADVAATDFTFTVSSAAVSFRGSIHRISSPNSNVAVDAHSMEGVLDTATPSFTANLTPSYTSEVFLACFVTRTAGISNTFSSYAIATSNPTWNEDDDSSGGSGIVSMASAHAVRTQVTASGALSVIIDGGASDTDTIGALIIIKNSSPVTITAVPGALTLAGGTTVIKFGVKILASVGTLVLAGGTQLIKRMIGWTNSSKTSTSWTNESKNTTAWTNQSKNSSSWTNKHKSS